MSALFSAEADSAQRRVELFVRSLAPETGRSQQESIIRRLQELEADGRIESLEVHLTGDCVCPDTAAAQRQLGSFLLDRFEAFESWATEEGVELVGFQHRCVDSTLTGETVTGIRFPRLCLAVYTDDRLELVVPATGESAMTVSEVLDALE
jgi:hypothetical protein